MTERNSSSKNQDMALLEPPRTRRAIISVANKEGLLFFVSGLRACGVELLSTAGTASLLKYEHVPVVDLGKYTGVNEIFGGRIKTLQTKVHAGILARRDVPSDMKTLKDLEIAPIDLVVVNFYPFSETISQPDLPWEEAIEAIDIGGPAMVRAAAKNHRFVTVVTDPRDYAPVLESIKKKGGVDAETRLRLATKAFSYTASYDAAIASSFQEKEKTREPLPEVIVQTWTRREVFRYGENPQDRGAFYVNPQDPLASKVFVRRTGSDLSYNNMLDADCAWRLVQSLDKPACVLVKHANPCGAAVGKDAADAFQKAHAADPVSAYGGIVAFNTPITPEVCKAMDPHFFEVLILEESDLEVESWARRKKRIRLLRMPSSLPQEEFNFRSILGGTAATSTILKPVDTRSFRLVTKRVPTQDETQALLFSWQVAKAALSNAIVLCRGKQTLAIGTGQQSRVDAVRVAVDKAHDRGHATEGAAAASDGFFPFADSVELLAKAGVLAIIQPGGSIRDAEVIEAANNADMAMLFTDQREFRH